MEIYKVLQDSQTTYEFIRIGGVEWRRDDFRWRKSCADNNEKIPEYYPRWRKAVGNRVVDISKEEQTSLERQYRINQIGI